MLPPFGQSVGRSFLPNKRKIRTEMKLVEVTIAEKKELRNHVLNYHKTRYVIDEMKACKNEKARQKYRDEHDSDFIILGAAKRYFDSKGFEEATEPQGVADGSGAAYQRKKRALQPVPDC